MIAPASYPVAGQQAPLDTGCVFGHGVGGRDVRVRLLTNNPAKAQKCGDTLREWGLAFMPQRLAMPSVKATFAFDLLASWESMCSIPLDDLRRQMFAGQEKVPRWIKFGGDRLMLDTLDHRDVMAFARFYDEHARRAAQYKKPKPPSLSDLADAGEIETVDCG